MIKQDPQVRFWAKVQKTEACWLWNAHLNENGYGRFWLNNKSVAAHRFSYKMVSGKIPDGLFIDHLCRVRRCVNPEHLEAVTCKENIRRGNTGLTTKTHCKRGHAFTEQNIYIRPGDKAKLCQLCRKILAKERHSRAEKAKR